MSGSSDKAVGGAASEATVRSGVAYALSGFGLWGLSPAYWKLLGAVAPFEILAHRIVWAVVFMVPVMMRGGRLAHILEVLRSPKIVLCLILSTLLISFNWFTFIWAVANERVLDTSLGYYLNPLINVALGFIVLREKLSPAQILAVALAAAGVAVMTFSAGSFPLISLLLALSFALYALVRKMVPVESFEGLFIETLACAPFALAYMIWLAQTGQNMAGSSAWVTILLIVAGPFTTLPLLLFTLGARRLRLSTLGIIQYIAPSLQFSLAVFAYGEPFTSAHLITFALIWSGLGVFSIDSIRRERRLRLAT